MTIFAHMTTAEDVEFYDNIRDSIPQDFGYEDPREAS